MSDNEIFILLKNTLKYFSKNIVDKVVPISEEITHGVEVRKDAFTARLTHSTCERDCGGTNK